VQVAVLLKFGVLLVTLPRVAVRKHRKLLLVVLLLAALLLKLAGQRGQALAFCSRRWWA
jgi:hypothetical protein